MIAEWERNWQVLCDLGLRVESKQGCPQPPSRVSMPNRVLSCNGESSWVTSEYSNEPNFVVV